MINEPPGNPSVLTMSGYDSLTIYRRFIRLMTEAMGVKFTDAEVHAIALEMQRIAMETEWPNAL